MTTLYVAETLVVERVPVAGRGERVGVARRGGERPHRLLREQDVIELASGRE